MPPSGRPERRAAAGRAGPRGSSAARPPHLEIRLDAGAAARVGARNRQNPRQPAAARRRRARDGRRAAADARDAGGGAAARAVGAKQKRVDLVPTGRLVHDRAAAAAGVVAAAGIAGSGHQRRRRERPQRDAVACERAAQQLVGSHHDPVIGGQQRQHVSRRVPDKDRRAGGAAASGALRRRRGALRGEQLAEEAPLVARALDAAQQAAGRQAVGAARELVGVDGQRAARGGRGRGAAFGGGRRWQPERGGHKVAAPVDRDHVRRDARGQRDAQRVAAAGLQLHLGGRRSDVIP